MTELRHAVELLLAGELVAFPTETVYGLAADAENPEAVAAIFKAKGRPADHPLIVHVAGAAHLERWACDIPALAWELAEAFWPGPLTLILKRQPNVHDGLTGGQGTVGLRVPGHPLALDLLREFHRAGGHGLAAPSANRFGRLSPTCAAHVREELGDRVAMILDGGSCAVGIESTIIDVSREAPVLLRPGRLRPETIAEVIGARIERPAKGDPAAPRVSGSLEGHYAPRTRMQLVAAEMLDHQVLRLLAEGRRVAVLSRSAPPADSGAQWIIAPLEADDFAHDLYASLRRLDGVGAELILVEAPPAAPAWDAVRDRLQRSSSGSGGAGF